MRNVFKEIASLADVLICNEEDYQLALGISGPSIVGTNIKNEIDSFKELIDNVKKAYPNTSIYANTLRDVKSANEYLWGATILDDDDLIVIEPKEIQVLDRIGGGDGFVGGLLYGLLNEWEIEKCAQFAWASGALATSFDVDYATPIDEEQILNIWYGNARVSR